MMFAAALNRHDWRNLRLSGPEFARMLIAGSAWGLIMSAGLAGMNMWNHGMVCVDDVVMTTATSIVAGILSIGPIAAYGRR